MQEPILIIQHEENEGPGYIYDWARQYKIPIKIINPQITALPKLGFRGVILLGGMMNVKDHKALPWLTNELQWVRKTIDHKTPIVGICLGAQILAHALGAEIKPMEQEELGWHSINWTATQALTIDRVFQAHNYYFDIPEGAKRLASSKLCPNQAFSYGKNILGLQFHLEWSQHKVAQLFPEYLQEYESSVKDHTASRELLFQLLNNHFLYRTTKSKNSEPSLRKQEIYLSD
ncbi:type 1 glutamine amidotransferase [uncultured Microbulbifer sp.]|uniref:type 1 glutamine amidotransferase n=1 Tax=uncultured Microbulbifer sp. TaxID=348147 RepID=UPI00262D7338|nr:type 1 glutamine amidotransferase [uncultured Microbulbifer sp.]